MLSSKLFLAVGRHSQIHFIGTLLLPSNCIIVSLTPSSDKRCMLNKVAVYMRLSESCRYFVELISLCRYHTVLRVRVVVCESWCFYKASLMGPGFNQSIKMVFVWHKSMHVLSALTKEMHDFCTKCAICFENWQLLRSRNSWML